MRKILNLILILFIFTFLFWQKDKITGNFNFLLAGPCDSPISYRLGEVDKDYGLTREQFLANVKEAGQIWSSVVKKNLFNNEPNGELTINLIYSERQSMADNLNKLEDNLQSGKQSLDSLTAEYQSLKADFESKLEAFNQEVLSWNKQSFSSNSRGGAPEEEFNRLKAQQDELKAEAERLNNLAQKLNLSVEQYNLNVGEFNQNAQSFNQAISERPEEGLYDGSVPKIDIYLTSSENELVHTLAHELGHAIGLSHTVSPDSVMYPWTNEVLQPDAQEKGQLLAYCQQKNWEIYFSSVAGKFNQEIKKFIP